MFCQYQYYREDTKHLQTAVAHSDEKYQCKVMSAEAVGSDQEEDRQTKKTRKTDLLDKIKKLFRKGKAGAQQETEKLQTADYEKYQCKKMSDCPYTGTTLINKRPWAGEAGDTKEEDQAEESDTNREEDREEEIISEEPAAQEMEENVAVKEDGESLEASTNNQAEEELELAMALLTRRGLSQSATACHC